METHIYRSMFELENRHWWFRGRRAVIHALLTRVQPSGPLSVLDAGCGTGRNLEEYARLGEATGIDPSPEAVAFCHERGLSQVIEGSLENLPFSAALFDVVCATDVLEHVDDDLGALTELSRVTRRGGFLLATVPAYQWLWSQSDVALHHRRRYTRPNLLNRIRKTGWEPEVATYFNSILLPPIALIRRLGRHRSGRAELAQTPSSLNGPLSAPMRLEAQVIRAGIRLPFGVSVGVLCRKP